MRSVHEYIEGHQADLLALLQKLVRIPTVNPPGACYQDLVDVLGAHCRKLGMDTAIYLVPEERLRDVLGSVAYPRPNLVARWDVGADQTLHFNGHYDVVPAAGNWRFGDPFAPAVSGGHMYGRGTADMKGAIAAQLAAIEAIRQAGFQPAMNVECSFTADEETGGELGAGFLVAAGHVRAEYLLVGEGAAGMQVGCGHNGVLWLQVQVEGRSAHASRPWEGVNAFEQMAQLVNELQRYKRSLSAARRRYRDPGGADRYPTVNFGGVFGGSAGDKVNTVPALARFTVDRRIVPGESINEVEGEVRGKVEQAARKLGIRCRVVPLLRVAPCVVDQNGALAKAFSRAVQAVRRGPTGFRVTTGFTDLRLFVNGLGVEGVGYGVKGERAHGVDERVSIHDLVQTAKTYAEFMLRGVTAP